MRSKDNTLISRLGFNDPDRSSNLHTLACQYLCRPENVAKVLSRVVGDAPSLESFEAVFRDGHDGWAREGVAVWDQPRPDLVGVEGPVLAARAGPWLDVKTETEVVIASGRSGFVSGFIDVRIRGRTGYADAVRVGTTDTRSVQGRDEKRYRAGVRYVSCDEEVCRECLLIEVKTNRIDVAQIAMQLGVYEAKYPVRYGERLHMVAALTWRLHPDEKAQLAAKGYHVIWLGPPFEKYCEERRNSSAVADEEAF